MDGATIYAPFHQFGIFSVFNDDIIQDANIQTGFFDPKFGGRTASFMDVSSKTNLDSNSTQNFHIGLLSSKYSLHKKLTNNSNILASARGTYGSFIAQPLITQHDFNIYFYDGSIKYNHHTDKAIWSFGSYYNTDKNSFNIDEGSELYFTNVAWQNQTNILNYKRFFRNKKTLELHLSNSNFNLVNEVARTGDFDIFDDQESDSVKLSLRSQLRDIKSSLVYSSKAWMIGSEGIIHFNSPSFIYENNSKEDNSLLEFQRSFESAIFLNYEKDIKFLQFSAGLRLNSFINNTIFWDIVPRVNISKSITKNQTISAGYDKTNQFLFSLQSAGIGLPTDIWLNANKSIAPQQAHLTSINYSISSKNTEITLSVFHKREFNVIMYRPGNTYTIGSEAVIEEGDGVNFSERLISGQQKGNGIELSFNLNLDQSKIFCSYTYLNVNAQFDSTSYGNWFESTQNRPHKLNISSQTKLSKKWTLKTNWIFNSGRNATISNLTYEHSARSPDGLFISYLPEYNNFKYPLYHRLDISAVKEIKLKRSNLKWSFGILNVYNKNNVNFYFTQGG